MTTEILVQTIVGGLLMGFIYALVAAGLSLIFGLMEIVNFAHGEFMMVSMYEVFGLYLAFGLDPLVSAPLCVMLMFALGVATHYGIIRHILNAPMEATLRHVYDLFPRLAERENQLAHSMSGGEQQMLALGRGLMARPRLLLVDEPLLGLSPVAARHTFEVLRRINETGVAILFIEQNVQTALGLAERGYILESGSLVLEGRSEELLGSVEVKQIFLGG